MPTPDDDTPRFSSRIIEWKIPLWQLLLACSAIAGFGITQYMKTEKSSELMLAMAEDLRDLKAEVKLANNADSATTREIALMQFRLGTVETELRVLRNMPHPKEAK